MRTPCGLKVLSARRATQVDAEIARVDADRASELIASGVTTQPVETVLAPLVEVTGDRHLRKTSHGRYLAGTAISEDGSTPLIGAWRLPVGQACRY